MCVKLLPENSNHNPYLPHLTSIYTCRVTTAPRVRGGHKYPPLNTKFYSLDSVQRVERKSSLASFISLPLQSPHWLGWLHGPRHRSVDLARQEHRSSPYLQGRFALSTPFLFFFFSFFFFGCVCVVKALIFCLVAEENKIWFLKFRLKESTSFLLIRWISFWFD